MPKAPLSDELQALIARPNPAVIATLRKDGSPHSVVTWYDWEDGRVLVNMDESRRRLEYLRQDPRVSLTVLAADDWYRHVTVMGRVVSLTEDVGLVDIDRLAERYTGSCYPDRDRRRFSAWIEIDSWHAWARTPDVASSSLT
jgi:PPOX class probable F420-dependent enzyme